jgi:hypothetical protein
LFEAGADKGVESKSEAKAMRGEERYVTTSTHGPLAKFKRSLISLNRRIINSGCTISLALIPSPPSVPLYRFSMDSKDVEKNSID